MQTVLPDRVLSDGTGVPGYRFRISEFPSEPLSRSATVPGIPPSDPEVRIVELGDASPEEELSVVRRVLAEASDGLEDFRVHVWGVRSAESVALIRSYYDALGFYEAKRNRYAYDCRTVRATFGCDLTALGYGPGVPPFGTYATKVVRTALNLEILKGLRPTDAPGTPGRRKKTPSEVLSDLLWSGAFAPYRLGRMLHFDMAERGLAPGFREWECPMPAVTAGGPRS